MELLMLDASHYQVAEEQFQSSRDYLKVNGFSDSLCDCIMSGGPLGLSIS